MTSDLSHPATQASPHDSPRTDDQLADDLESTASELTTLADAAALNSGFVRLDWLRADEIADLAAHAAHLLRRNTEGQHHP